MPGHRYASGLALDRELRAGVVPAVEIRSGIEEVAARLRGFTPEVDPLSGEPGVFWLDASGLARLYPSLDAWGRRVQRALTDMGMHSALVCGFSRFGTYAVARARRRGVTTFATPAAEQEIIDNAPYVRTWFYWRYDDGWAHVPPDYTFWGDERTLETDSLRIQHQDVDAPLAESLATTVTDWLVDGCAILGCEALPQLNLEIVPQPGLIIQWSTDDPWLMRVPSPYTDISRLDMPFDFGMRFDLATLLAERLVSVASNEMQPVYPADAFYLHSAIGSWLVGRFVGVDTHSFLIDSLATQYGDVAVESLLQLMQPDSKASVLNIVTGADSLAQTTLDWRDFLTWRLALEDELIARREEGHFLTLYDTRDGETRTQAYNRFNAGTQAGRRTVVSTVMEPGPDGAMQLRATVDTDAGQVEALFRLVNGDWLRAN